MSEGVCEEELDVIYEGRLEGVSEGESERVCGRGSDGESVGELARVGLGVCAGVGSCGSVQTGCPSAIYHTSLCLFNSFKGLHTHTQTHRNTRKEQERRTQQLQMRDMSSETCVCVCVKSLKTEATSSSKLVKSIKENLFAFNNHIIVSMRAPHTPD